MRKLSEQEIEERVERATALFMQGYNCSQAVFCALSDLYEVPEEMALRMSASFGGGIGRMRLTCGAASGMFMLAGFERGQVKPHDPEQKLANYALVQDLAARFTAEHGSMTCSELLAKRAAEKKAELADTAQVTAIVDSSTSPVPAERNEAYYHQRPCLKMITSAVRIYCEALNSCPS